MMSDEMLSQEEIEALLRGETLEDKLVDTMTNDIKTDDVLMLKTI